MILTLDLGSTAAKAGLVNSRGEVVVKASVPTPQPRGDVREVDPSAWWTAAVEAVRALDVRWPVETVVLCGFMHTLVGLDDEGAAVGPAVLMGDSRTEQASAAAADCARRIAAWAEREPEAAARVKTYLTPKDYLRFRLTGQPATDLYDITGAGRPEQAPRILAPGEVAGAVTGEAAAILGLRAGTPVLTGSGDWLANLVGTAAALPERLCLYLGTSAAVGAFLSTADMAGLRDPRCFAAAADSGTVLERSLRMLFPHRRDPYAAAAQALDDSPIGAGGVTFEPYLGGTRPGQPDRRGALLGLHLGTTRADLARAVLEGFAFWIRELTDGHPARELVLCGGGARSPVWAELLADVLGTVVLVPEEVDAGLVGLARIADPDIPDVTARPVRGAEPDPHRVISNRAQHRV
ncbi:MAG: FGGY family carbohydrate kinase [Kibdelosporangium sp.]